MRGAQPLCPVDTNLHVYVGAVLGMLFNEKVCFKCTSPYRSIAKRVDLAKHTEKHTFQKFRQNLYILTTASRCILEHLEFITKMKIIFLYCALSCLFQLCSHHDLCTELVLSLKSESYVCEKMRYTILEVNHDQVLSSVELSLF